MSFLMPCPHCGDRSVYEFRFGGEVKQRPQPGRSGRGMDGVHATPRPMKPACRRSGGSTARAAASGCRRCATPSPTKFWKRFSLNNGGQLRKFTFEFDWRDRGSAARATPSLRRSIARAGASSRRSFKYHRPRGLLCLAGKCPNCLMNVDGAPNVRTCITPVRAGMQVRAPECVSVARQRLAVGRAAFRLADARGLVLQDHDACVVVARGRAVHPQGRRAWASRPSRERARQTTSMRGGTPRSR